MVADHLLVLVPLTEFYHITESQRLRFAELLNTVDRSLLNKELYHDRYLGYLLSHKEYFIKIYAHVLEHAVQFSGKPPSEIRLVDYGAGNGLLGLFASFCGFGKVILVDSNPAFTGAADCLSKFLSIELQGIVTGELDELATLIGDARPDVFVGTDVIEHIYDLRKFFRQIRVLNPAAVTVFTTASNPSNPIKVRKLKKYHLKDEFEGGVPEDFEVLGEQLPFIEIRRDIIIKLGIEEKSLVEAMAIATRGMREDDIKKAVDLFRVNGILPDKLSHPTNTCHPLTGCWTERVLEIEEYRQIYDENGFEMKIFDGFYNTDKVFPLDLFIGLINSCLPYLYHSLSPFITLVGRKQ